MICLGDFREMPNFVGTNPQAGKTGARGSVLRRRQFRVGWGGAKTECKMNMLDNPLVWLMRIRHRCGYGVHSPFAFRFLTDVVYERTPYYAYSTLDEALPLAQRLYLTRVEDTPAAADAFFPPFDEADWRTEHSERHDADERNDMPYTFIDYCRK